MAQNPTKPAPRHELDGLLACRIPVEIITQIDNLVARADYPTTRSDVMRKLIYDALKAHIPRRRGIRAAS